MSRATIAQLEAFYWVSELGSVHRAATRLNVTQPTLSLRLRALQAGLPGPVLELQGRSLRLTRAGHAFLPRVKLVLEAYAQLDRNARRATLAGVLRIGLAEGFAVACLPHLVPAFAQNWPMLRPEWTVTTSAALEPSILNGTLDLAVLVDPIGDLSLGLIPLGSQRNIWAGSALLARQAMGSAAEMAKMTVISTPPPTSMHRNTMAWFARLGLVPGPFCLCTSVNAAAQLAAAGIGIGIFPARMIEAYQSQGTLTPIEVPETLPPGHVFIAHRTSTDQDRVDAAVAVIERVTRRLDYFGHPG